MFSSKINSYDKKNLTYAAMGTYQIEYFDIGEQRYFAIYRHQIESAREIVIKLADATITRKDDDTGYYIKVGNNTHKLSINRTGNKIVCKFTQYVLGWLPFQSFRGTITNTGNALIECEFAEYLFE